MPFSSVDFMRAKISDLLHKIVRPAALSMAAALSVAAQTSVVDQRNNPYSPSPGRQQNREGSKVKNTADEVSFVMQSSSRPQRSDDFIRTVAVKDSSQPVAPAPKSVADERALAPSETYKVGPGDVLLITLKNAPQGSGYYTVQANGTIEYPLARGVISVADRSTESIKQILKSAITLFKDPEVDVRVRQFGSHRITVSGLVDNPGEKFLQREAMPLFTIQAEAGVQSRASHVRLTRDGQSQVLALKDAKTGEMLVVPGMQIEFLSSADTGGSYFIGGEVVGSGQRNLTSGLTLYQAVVSAGGTKGDPKKALIRRKNEKGMLVTHEHDLRSIKAGRSMDPYLAAGDIIEIKN